MDAEKAREIFNDPSQWVSESIWDAIEFAIKAIEKQTPMATRLECDGPEQWLVCPSCGDTGVEDERPYCKECGQAIDWSEFQEV